MRQGYRKFEHFLTQIVPGQSGQDLEALLNDYASHVRHGLLTCDITPRLAQLRELTPSARWLIVSGGDQDELRDVFAQRGISEWFDGGIFGSPDTKDEILQRELSFGNIQKPALFLGDSKYDYQAATNAGLDFIFLSGWSEVIDWQLWIANEGIDAVRFLRDLA